ncbi:MAG: Spy/CpxP family protein refolding chaperone [Magnetococcales bacterium]|nr:Spy/CpxP family protein refolding chaperone [Magnetococcales bacterium]
MKNSTKQLFKVTALLALTTGLYLATDSIAQGTMGRHMMMGGQPGMTNYQGMGPGMMMGRQPGMTNYQGMGPGMMMGQIGGYNNGYQHMGPGMTGNHMWHTTQTTDGVATDNYLNNIKSSLAITSAQKDAWNSYAAAVKDQTTLHNQIHDTMHTTYNQSQLEHLTSMEAVLAQKQEVFKAYKDLYATLDDRQRTTANQLTWSCHG